MRGKLLQYYFAQSRGHDWARHLLWLIERHPESELLSPLWQRGDAGAVGEVLADSRLMEAFRTGWQRATVANPSNVAVLRNAARFYMGEDVRAAMTALRRARVVNPQDERVVQEVNLVEFRAWMADAGLNDISRINGAAGTSLMIGIK